MLRLEAPPVLFPLDLLLDPGDKLVVTHSTVRDGDDGVEEVLRTRPVSYTHLDVYKRQGLDFDVVFGPAYKGIPLSVITVIGLQELYGKEARYCSNRKEVKDHGADAGNLLGSELHDGDRVIMVEDVTSSGKSIDETYPVLKGAADVDVKGLIVSLNRMEVGKGGVVTAQQEVQEKYGFPVASIVSMAEVTECLHNREVQGRVVIDDDVKAALDAYYEQYGVK